MSLRPREKGFCKSVFVVTLFTEVYKRLWEDSDIHTWEIPLHIKKYIYVCISIYTCVCVYIYIYISLSISVCVCVCIPCLGELNSWLCKLIFSIN